MQEEQVHSRLPSAFSSVAMGNGGSETFEDDTFKTAFVVYVMVIITDPMRPTHWDSQNYLPSLLSVERAASSDWSKAILEDVFLICD